MYIKKYKNQLDKEKEEFINTEKIQLTKISKLKQKYSYYDG